MIQVDVNRQMDICPPLRNHIRRGLSSWLLAAAMEYFRLPGQMKALSGTEGLAEMSLLRLILTGLLLFILLGMMERFFGMKKLRRLWLPFSFCLLAGVSLCYSFSWGYLCICLLIAVILLFYAAFGWRGDAQRQEKTVKTRWVWLWVTASLACLFVAFVSFWGISRLMSFRSPTYDMGLFTQMFHHMRTSGLPMTTLERDGLLSHFHVHVSPIYYCMLPFYSLFPSPVTLQILQAVIMALAVVPLWKLGSVHGLSGFQRMLLCSVLLFFPAFSGGAAFDLHENCFLTVLILWIFYGLDSEKPWITWPAAALTLMVKEDAAVYVAVIGLWFLLRCLLQKDKRGALTGGALMAISVAWFVITTGYLARFGDGVMTWRYGNFMFGESPSLFTVIQAVLMHPMKLLYECMEPSKMNFIARTMLPLLGLPLLTRRYERYILLIPYVLMNLMSDYGYQHDIFFQYTFGSNAFLFYLALVNLADMKGNFKKSAALCLAAGACAGCFVFMNVPKAWDYTRDWMENRESFAEVRQVLQEIPKEAAVTADTFYTVQLANRDVLYDMDYASTAHILESEYVVIDPSDEKSGGVRALLETKGYQLWLQAGDRIEVYTR